VQIAGTVSEGEEIAGFRVIELPGHAPGQIGLWRDSDRLALVSDCFYTLDMWGRDAEPHVPFGIYNYDTEQARASIRKVAELEPAAAWPGHAKPVTGDVRGALLRAEHDYADAEGNELRLRGALSAGSRHKVAEALAGSPLSREDAEQRAFELLFERLAVRWTVAGVPMEGQRELLGRLRLATPAERRWVRETLRAHCAEHFPDVQVP
jgi:glyoxylase-like metal-dependent hydrolase (beta-lactamase superfamily II)